MFANVLEELMRYESLEEITIVAMDGEKYVLNKEKCIGIFALNAVLVLEKCRLCYKVDIRNATIQEELLKIAVGFGLTVIPSSDGEPLLVRKNRLKEVRDIAKNNNESTDGMARLLGYDYNCSDWASGKKSLAITYVAFDEKGEEYDLYTYRIPDFGYDEKLKERIEEKRRSIETVLKSYGYSVKVDVSNLQF